MAFVTDTEDGQHAVSGLFHTGRIGPDLAKAVSNLRDSMRRYVSFFVSTKSRHSYVDLNLNPFVDTSHLSRNMRSAVIAATDGQVGQHWTLAAYLQCKDQDVAQSVFEKVRAARGFHERFYVLVDAVAMEQCALAYNQLFMEQEDVRRMVPGTVAFIRLAKVAAASGDTYPFLPRSSWFGRKVLEKTPISNLIHQLIGFVPQRTCALTQGAVRAYAAYDSTKTGGAVGVCRILLSSKIGRIPTLDEKKQRTLIMFLDPGRKNGGDGCSDFFRRSELRWTS